MHANSCTYCNSVRSEVTWDPEHALAFGGQVFAHHWPKGRTAPDIDGDIEDLHHGDPHELTLGAEGVDNGAPAGFPSLTGCDYEVVVENPRS